MPTPLKYTIGIVITLGGLFCLLAFGNPQWCNYVYITQAYIKYRGNFGLLCLHPRQGLLNPPNGYTGVWKNWIDLEHPDSILNYDKGSLQGLQFYYENGTLLFVEYIKDGETENVYNPYLKIDRRAEFGIETK